MKIKAFTLVAMGAFALMAAPAAAMPAGSLVGADGLSAAEHRAATAELDGLVVEICGARCAQNRRVSRRTSRRTSRRVSNRHNYYGGRNVVVYDDRGCCDAGAAVAAGVVGLAVGAAIASSASNSNSGAPY